VVVVGFGPAGASAGLAAARAGARVVALSRRHVDGEAQAQARAAGVEVRRAVAGELDVELGRVVGVGYAALPDPAGCPFCDCSGARDQAPAWCTPTAHVACSAVVLAVDAGNWDFVGCAVWSALRGRTPAIVGAPVPPPARAAVGRIGAELVVPGAVRAAPDTWAPPELAVRRWCAEREGGPAAAADQAPLHVDGSGEVTVGGDRPVVGLFSAVPARPGGPLDVAAARRAGRAAARTPAPVALHPVG
jgi:hypothetical protein